MFADWFEDFAHFLTNPWFIGSGIVVLVALVGLLLFLRSRKGED